MKNDASLINYTKEYIFICNYFYHGIIYYHGDGGFIYLPVYYSVASYRRYIIYMLQITIFLKHDDRWQYCVK